MLHYCGAGRNRFISVAGLDACDIFLNWMILQLMEMLSLRKEEYVYVFKLDGTQNDGPHDG